MTNFTDDIEKLDFALRDDVEALIKQATMAASSTIRWHRHQEKKWRVRCVKQDRE